MNFDFLNQQVLVKKQKGQYRQVQTSVSQRPGMANFASNDYLGLNGHPDIIAAFEKGLSEYGSSSCSAALIDGHSKPHQYLQDQICDWLGTEQCLLFSSGFSANSGMFSTLLKTGQLSVIYDRLSHASMLANMFHFPKACQRFKHNDSKDLSRRLQKSTSVNKLVAVEGVYSMDGDMADIAELYRVTKQYNAAFYLDDAHGIGVKGEFGQGSISLSFSDVPNDITQMITFGKAIATTGAAIAGSKNLVEFLTNYCGEYIFSTAMSAANAMATSKSIELIQEQSWRRDKLKELKQTLLENLDSNVETTASDSPIVGIYTGSEEDTLNIAGALLERGYLVSAIRPPTVEPGKSRLRVTLSANHNDRQIIGLANALNELLEQERIAC